MLYSITLPRTQFIAVGRPLCRLRNTTNASEFASYLPVTLRVVLIHGALSKSSAEMRYLIEISERDPNDNSEALVAADWSTLAQAERVEGPSQIPPTDPALPDLTHSPSSSPVELADG